MNNDEEVMPQLSADGELNGVRYFGLGPFYCSDNSDMAYLYDPDAPGEGPWEVIQSGSHTLSLTETQAESLLRQLVAKLGK